MTTENPQHLMLIESGTGWGGPPLRFASEKTQVIGRASDSDAVISHEGVSRRHGLIERRAGRWWISDTASKHGTAVNNQPLKAGQWAPLHDGDSVRIGPLTFIAQCASEPVRASANPMTIAQWLDDIDADQDRRGPSTIRRLSGRDGLAQRRLDLLVHFATAMAAARSELDVCRRIAEAAREALACSHAVIVRTTSDASAPEIVCVASAPASAVDSSWRISRSLLRAAASDGTALLASAPDGVSDSSFGHSVIDLAIHSALCVRIESTGASGLFLYADSRGRRSAAHPGLETEAAEFCAALARVGGMAVADLRRKALESEHQALARDLEAARQMQLLLMPPATGSMAGARYAYLTRPGRYVAGDLLDCLALDDGRLAFFLGDVTGKGASAGIVMAGAQTYLAALLRQTGDPAAAVTGLNHFMWHRIGPSRFASLWVGVLDARTGVLDFVDAGHGLWLLRSSGRPLSTPACEGGLLVGVDEHARYTAERIQLRPGDRLLLMSDGVVEQRNRSDSPLGMHGVVAALAPSNSAAQDAADLFAALLHHAGAEDLADDATIASFELPT